MNKEIRELLDKNNIVVKKITIKHNVMIIDTGNRKMVIKKAQSPLQLINQQIHYGLHYHVPTPMVNQLKTPLAKNTFH